MSAPKLPTMPKELLELMDFVLHVQLKYSSAALELADKCDNVRALFEHESVLESGPDEGDTADKPPMPYDLAVLLDSRLAYAKSIDKETAEAHMAGKVSQCFAPHPKLKRWFK